MTVLRMENVGIVVDDLGAATALFVELGVKLLGDAMRCEGSSWRLPAGQDLASAGS